MTERFRPLLFSIAYRMLGSVADAEDVVQEALLRFERETQAGKEIESPKAFLTTVTTRLAIDQLRSARVQRETYFGTWLPEPLLTADEDEDPAKAAELADSLSLSFLVLLERLTPVERAVFLLREVFDYGYDEIAGVIEKSEANCRQILTRARKRVDEDKPRFEADRAKQEELAGRFMTAVQEGEIEQLVKILAADAVFYGDGGGVGRGVPKPVYGRDRLGRLLAAFHTEGARIGAQIRQVWVNGQAGVLILDRNGGLIAVMAFEIADEQVQSIRSIINPEKLAHLGLPMSDVARRRTPR
jgi:RNA polymerase sigma-70 factor, ECF subfamily